MSSPHPPPFPLPLCGEVGTGSLRAWTSNQARRARCRVQAWRVACPRAVPCPQVFSAGLHAIVIKYLMANKLIVLAGTPGQVRSGGEWLVSGVSPTVVFRQPIDLWIPGDREHRPCRFARQAVMLCATTPVKFGVCVRVC